MSTAKPSVSDKLSTLQELGREDLVDLFKEWSPRTSTRVKTAPLDQRVTLMVTSDERRQIEDELTEIKKSGQKTSLSQLIRSRAILPVDAEAWRELAVSALDELDETEKDKTVLTKLRLEKIELLDEATDPEDVYAFGRELEDLTRRLDRLKAKTMKRNVRLTGRTTLVEAETIRWRASRLCLSSSDYMRFALFGSPPNSDADAHLSLEGKRRFYVSIVDVADKGWGEPPNLAHCNQCSQYLEELRTARDRVKQLETFL